MVEPSNNEDGDIKDEDADNRVLGKRTFSEKSTNRTGRTDKKGLSKAKVKEDRSHPKRSASRDKPAEPKRSRPGSKEARLKRLGKWTEPKPQGGSKRDSVSGKSGRPDKIRKSTPTFKR